MRSRCVPPGLLALVIFALMSLPAAAEEDGGARYPEYVVAGAISLAAAGGLAAGGVVSTFDDSPQTAIGLLGLGTVAAGVGVPLVMLGAAAEQPVSTFRMATGVALATPGVLSLGFGGAMWASHEASDSDQSLALPLAMVIGGAVATVAGVIVYATGAGPADPSADRTEATTEATIQAKVVFGPTQVALTGTF